MNMIFKLLLSIFLAFLFFSSSTIAMEDQDSSSTIPSKPKAVQSTSQIETRTPLEALSDPLFRKILLFLGPSDPRDICRIARTSSKINKSIDEDSFLWAQIYRQNYPHALFGAMEPKDKEGEVGLLNDAFRDLREYSLDPNNPGGGYRKMFKRYLHIADAMSWGCEEITEAVRQSAPALAILLRSSKIALAVLELCKPKRPCKKASSPRHDEAPKKNLDFGRLEALKLMAIIDAPCFNEEVREKAMWLLPVGQFPKYIDRGYLCARYCRMHFLLNAEALFEGAISIEGFQCVHNVSSYTEIAEGMGGRKYGMDFYRQEHRALSDSNYFPTLLGRLRALAGRYPDDVYEPNPVAAKQEYERCVALFAQDNEKLLQVVRAYGKEPPSKYQVFGEKRSFR